MKRQAKAAARRNNLWGIWRRLALVIVTLVIGLNVYLWNARYIVKNAMPMPFGVGASVVLSGSMVPTLNVNDLVIVRQADSCEIGDVVVYQHGESLIVHRVISMDGDTLTTQGDANNLADEPIHISAVKGIVIASIPAAGNVVRMLKTSAGVVGVLSGAILLVILSFRKEKEADSEQLNAIKVEIRRLRAELDEDSKQESKCPGAAPDRQPQIQDRRE